ASSAQTQAMPASIGTTDMSFLGLGRIYAYDPLAAFNAGVWGFTPNNDTGIVANRYEIEEKVLQGYVQFDIAGKLGSVPVTGNIGVRSISVDQSSDGFSGNGPVLTAVSGGDKYTNWAPNLNLNFNFTPKTVLRFGLGRQYARPRMYDMRASRTWGYDPSKAASTDINNSPWSGSGGNPELKPWQSDSVDLSLEHYFKDNRGYFAVAGYLKDLKNYIYEQHSIADFTGYPVSSGPEPALRQGIVSQPMNGDGGKLNGFEVTLSLSSELINPNFKGFGLIGTYAYTDSKIKPWGPTGGDAPIAGLSEKVASGTLYYERHGFSARISDRYRGENRQYITNFGVPSPGGDVNPNGGFSMAQPENQIDAQVSYTFQKGPLKNLSIVAMAYNLTNEPLITYDQNDPRRVINYQEYGASYSVGVSYKY
ncbi:MAG TPA: TonB-dependent receptor, partial [Candidatus Didemnitutus sp.]|nr:TonB-dependent receptor [Candidatus Didemnitutus sp.]